MRFIKLYEKITEWEWYDDAITFKVFMHLLLTANWKDTNYHGVELKRGQRLISYQGLADELHLSPKQIRTAITHLKRTNEAASERAKVGANKGQVITIENYEKYQGSESSEGKQEGKPQGKKEGRQRATDIEDIEVSRTIEEKNTTYSKRKSESPIRNQIPPTVEMVREYCESRHNGINAEDFCDFYTSKNWMIGKNKMKDWQASVRTWEKKHGGTNRNNQEVRGTSTRVSDEKRQAVEEWEARQRALFSGQ